MLSGRDEGVAGSAQGVVIGNEWGWGCERGTEEDRGAEYGHVEK